MQTCSAAPIISLTMLPQATCSSKLLQLIIREVAVECYSAINPLKALLPVVALALVHLLNQTVEASSVLPQELLHLVDSSKILLAPILAAPSSAIQLQSQLEPQVYLDQVQEQQHPAVEVYLAHHSRIKETVSECPLRS